MNRQLDLFGTPPPTDGIVRDVGGVKGLWYLPRFLESSLQTALLEEVDARPWLDDLKRRVQHYGYRYNYKARSIDHSMAIGPLPEFAVRVADALIEVGLLEKIPDQLIVNEYQPGQGITPHIDCVPCFANRIVTVSLGSDCEMEFISRDDPPETRAHLLEQGSALLLHDEARFDWMHCIRPRSSDGPQRRRRRVSLTFRNVILASGSVSVSNGSAARRRSRRKK